MEMKPETVKQVVSSVTVVLLFIVVMLVVGSLFYDGGFGEMGALVLVGVIVGFVVVMSAVGYYVNR